MKQSAKNPQFGLRQFLTVGVVVASFLAARPAQAAFSLFSWTESPTEFHDLIYWFPNSSDNTPYVFTGPTWSRTLSVTQFGPANSTLWRFAWSVQQLAGDAQVLSGTLDFDTASSHSFSTSFTVSNDRGIDSFSFSGFREDSPNVYYLGLRTEHIQPVPEPGTLALLGAAAVTMSLASIRKRKRHDTT